MKKSDSFTVMSPDGKLVQTFESVVDAVAYMRSTCKAGARVLRASDGALLAVRVSRTGTRSTLKGALKKHREPASTLH